MKYYKNPLTGEIFAYESDGSQDVYISTELVRMTNAEVESHLKHNEPTIQEWRETCTVRRAAFKLALAELDLIDMGEAAILSAPKALQIRWADEVNFNRLDSDLVSFATTQLELTDTQIDDVFKIAETK